MERKLIYKSIDEIKAYKKNPRKNAGAVDADLFAGSGPNLIACEQSKRISYNMEIAPKYCDVIINRWETFTGKKAVLIEASDGS